ncbi:LRRC74A [Blepharisma stoltei]|uniref:Uncharacterized protein n=1 Tax=Blepharisma stoltei TaxID=1481888 RepID=A0AAU9KF12_9CILI|nr:unnamed protein product [Blepharisma stoltei]
MSVYGGFATRAQESAYNGLLSSLIDLLHLHAISYIQNLPLDFSTWSEKFARIHKNMTSLETQKYQPPKFSLLTQPLADLIMPKLNISRNSKQSSKRVTRENSSYYKFDDSKTNVDSTPNTRRYQNFSISQDIDIMLMQENFKIEERTPREPRVRQKKKVSIENSRNWSNTARSFYKSPNKKPIGAKLIQKYQDEALMRILKDLSSSDG